MANKQIEKLTSIKVRNTRKPGRYADGAGLYLQVTDTGAKSWVFRYERNGTERMYGIGPLHTVTLKEARELARKARQKLLDGIDPIEERKAAKAKAALEAAQAITFEDAAKQFYAKHEKQWKNAKHRAQFLSTMKEYVFPLIGKLSVGDIETGHVRRVMEPIWPRIPETAYRVRQRIEAVLSWAIALEYRKGPNPARWVGNLDKAFEKRSSIKPVKHHSALPYVDLPAFMADLSKREGIAARALEFTILTAARTNEAIGARWSEIDLVTGMWTLPPERMKAAKEHKVPLSDKAISILKSLPRESGSPFIFIGTTTGMSISDMAMAQTLKRMGRTGITVHGFRSTFRDWVAEATGYADAVGEQALAHVIPDKVERAYKRGNLLEKRTRLMSDWAAYCYGPSPTSNNVVGIRSEAA